MRDLVRLLDRQYKCLVGQRPSRMLLAVPRFVAFLRQDPRLGPILKDLDDELVAAVDGAPPLMARQSLDLPPGVKKRPPNGRRPHAIAKAIRTAVTLLLVGACQPTRPADAVAEFEARGTGHRRHCFVDPSESDEEERRMQGRMAAKCTPYDVCILACTHHRCGDRVGGGCYHLFDDPSMRAVERGRSEALTLLRMADEFATPGAKACVSARWDEEERNAP